MSHVRRFDHVGLTVADLDVVTAFFVALGLELSSFVRPDSVPGSPAATANELGLRNVAFEVNDLQAATRRARRPLTRCVRGGVGFVDLAAHHLLAACSKAR